MTAINKGSRLSSKATKSRSRSASGTEGTQDDKTRYSRNSKTISGRLHDELVMMDLDQGKYFSLNPVATRIWDLLGEPMDLGGLCKRLMEEYDVDYDQCRADVGNHLSEMEKMGLLLSHKG